MDVDAYTTHETYPDACQDACQDGSSSEGAPFRLTRQLVAHTFRFAQGSVAVQQRLVTYLKLCHPELTLDDATRQRLEVECTPAILALASSSPAHVPIESEDALTELQSVLRLFQRQLDEFGAIYPPTERALVRHFLFDVIERDLTYLDRPTGRQRRGMRTRNPHHDPWLSQLCHYGLLAQPTGSHDFDRLFSALADEARRERRDQPDRQTSTNLLRIVALWNKQHSDRQISSQTLSAEDESQR